MNISEWLQYNKDHTEHDSFAIVGARGSGKTTHMMAMAYELKVNGYKIKICYDIDDIPEDLHNYDCLFLDDFATKFYKRDSGTKKNKEFAKLIQEIREVLPLIITTAPGIGLFDKDIRMMFKPLHIIHPGMLVIEGGIKIDVNLLQDGFPRWFLAHKRKERKRKQYRAGEFIKSMRG